MAPVQSCGKLAVVELAFVLCRVLLGAVVRRVVRPRAEPHVPRLGGIAGTLIAQHGGSYYPDALMSINFNLWFIEGGLVQTDGIRQYEEDIDWVFHEAGVLLMPDEVTAKGNASRNAPVKFTDTVLSGIPTSPCDL